MRSRIRHDAGPHLLCMYLADCHNPAFNGSKHMNKKECHLIPEKEKKCVWMTTGLISYKLCAHDYRCETCIFDQVMRNESSTGYSCEKTGTKEELSATDASTRMRWSLFYHPGHCWAQVEDPENVRIGVDDVLTRLMVRVKAIVLPQEGDTDTPGGMLRTHNPGTTYNPGYRTSERHNPAYQQKTAKRTGTADERPLG